MWRLVALGVGAASTLMAQRTVSLSVPGNQIAGAGAVTVVLASLGNENAVGFSVTFDPAALRFDAIGNGADLGGATLNVNSSQVASGRIGVALALPSGATYPAGNRALAVLNFTVVRASTANTALGFGDTPVVREVSDARANVLVAAFAGVTVAAGPSQTAPAITSQPVASTVTEGATASFSVGATGSAPLSYQWRKDGVALAGATNAVLTLTNVTQANAGTYQAVVTNSAGTTFSNGASLVVRAAPAAPTIVTPPLDVSAPVGTPVTLIVTATGDAPLSYQWLRSGVAIAGATNSTLNLAGLAADAGAYAVRVSNAAGSVISPTAQVTLTAIAPLFSLSQAPASQALLAGASTTLFVSAFFTAAITSPGASLSYRWFKDGTPVAGATSPELALNAVTPAQEGVYVAEVAGAGATLRTPGARVTVVDRPFAPIIVRQPAPVVALAGSAAALAIAASGQPAPAYQWRRDGVAIAGATNAAFTLAPVQPAHAAVYDVVVSNAAGSSTSSLAPLAIAAAPAAPIITRQPAAVTVPAGRSVRLAVEATGAPAPGFQWRRDGVPLPGATDRELGFERVGPAEAGIYSVEIRNTAGTVVSREAGLRVLPRSYAGSYHGTAGSAGRFALHIREDNTAILLATVGAARAAYYNRAVTIRDDGGFRLAAATASGESLTFEGDLADSGAVTGTLSGGGTGTFSGSKAGEGGATGAFAGFYQLAAAGSATQLFAMVGPGGRAFVLSRTGATTDGGEGVVDAAGRVSVVTDGQANVRLELSAELGTASGSLKDARGNEAALAGFRENAAASAEQRVVNISTRTTVGSGATDSVAIVGFVVAGLESKPVLIRAVGPTLRDFGVASALGSPRLELIREGATIASNAGWGTAANVSQVVAAGARAGAFPLATGSADAVVLAVLAPGTYSAVVNATDRGAGVVLVEVYDLAGTSSAQKLVNISTRGTTAAGDATLIAGVSVTGSAPKRLLLRAAGPALGQFGVAGALTQPVLRLYAGSALIAENSGWSSSADAAVIAEETAQVGAFAFAPASRDAAIVVNLAPGSYTAQVAAADGAAGVTLVEVYEVP